jgi:cobalt-precorrin 5A hydrolase
VSGLAFITLSAEGAALHPALAEGLSGLRLFVHHSAGPLPGATQFERIQDLTAELFPRAAGLIFVAPCGVVIRSIAPALRHKREDPAVVVLDVRARWCVSLLSGHEGGANDLALRVANLLGAEPVITTTTEARKDVCDRRHRLPPGRGGRGDRRRCPRGARPRQCRSRVGAAARIG